jgi:hypothetical protein
MRPGRGWVWLAAAAVAIALWLRGCGLPSTLSLAQAVTRGALTVEAFSGDASDVLQLRLTLHSSAATTVTIPAGTVYSPRGAYQGLLAAETVRVHFAGLRAGAGRVQVVEVSQRVYCLDRFSPLPASGSAFDYGSGDDGASEPVGPLAELAACLETRHAGAAQDARQMAIWLVRHDLLRKTRAEARELFRDGLRESALARLDAVLQAQEAELVAQGFAPEDAAAGLREYRETHLAATLDEVIDAELAKDWPAARPLLRDCGVAVDDAPFFRD